MCAAWKSNWGSTRKLYTGLTKAETAVLCQLRTEVIGLRAWLASVGVPGVEKECDCGETQTVKHMLIHCPQYQRWPWPPWKQVGCEDPHILLNRRNWVEDAARWVINEGILEQFRVAKEVGECMGERREGQERKEEEDEGISPWVLL